MSAQRKVPVSPKRATTGRRMLVGVQWDAACWSRVPLLVDRVLRHLHAIPLHWNLPAFPPAERPSAVVPVLRERLASAGDALLAMGYAGACQPALALDELDREIAWGLRNPWSTGIVDVLGRRPVAAAPRLADLDRPEAARPLLRHGLSLVGVADPRPFDVRARNGLRVFPYVRLPGRGADDPDLALRRALAGGGDAFLVLDLAALPPAPAAAAPLIEAFADRVLASGRTAVSLAEAAREAATSEDAHAAVPCGEWTLFPEVALRRRLEAADAPRRRRRRRTEETRDLLAQLSAATPDPPAPPPAPPRRYADRGLIAHMQGETTLSGAAFDVRLAGGRFCGLARGREALTPARTAGSWLRVDGRTIEARTRSAFSFEGDEGTGLREDLALGADGSLVVDYAFRGDEPALAIEGTWVFPALPDGGAVAEWAPLVLALAEVPAAPGIEIAFEAPDGSGGTRRILEADGWCTLAGRRFRVGAGDREVVLETRGPGSPWGAFLFRLARGRLGRRLVEVNPAGARGPLPAAGLAGSRGEFAFTVGLGRP